MFYSYILFIFYLCISCASQEVPSGGPIDKDGPQLLNIYPKMLKGETSGRYIVNLNK